MAKRAKSRRFPLIESASDLAKWRERILAGRDPDQVIVTVCGGTGCRGSGAEAVIEAFKDAIKKFNVEKKVKVGFRETGCHGFCERGPLVVIRPKKIFYQMIKPDDVEEILEKTVLK